MVQGGCNNNSHLSSLLFCRVTYDIWYRYGGLFISSGQRRGVMQYGSLLKVEGSNQLFGTIPFQFHKIPSVALFGIGLSVSTSSRAHLFMYISLSHGQSF